MPLKEAEGHATAAHVSGTSRQEAQSDEEAAAAAGRRAGAVYGQRDSERFETDAEGGAGLNVSNLKKLCAAAGLANVGSKAQLASRLEQFLREKTSRRTPSSMHADDLPFAEFDAKYQAMTVLEIAAVEGRRGAPLMARPPP